MVQKKEYAYKLLLLLSDGAALVAAYSLSLWLRFVAFQDFFDKSEAPGTLETYALLMPLLVAAWLVIFRSCGCYAATHGPVDTAFSVFKGAFYGSLFIFAVDSLFRGFSYSRGALFLFIPLSAVLVLLFRVIVRKTQMSLLARTHGLVRLAILGTEAAAEKLAREIVNRPNIGYDLVGIVVEAGVDGASGPGVASFAVNRRGPDAPALSNGPAVATTATTAVAQAAQAAAAPARDTATAAAVPPASARKGFPDRPVLGSADRLAVLIREHALDEVWIAMPSAERAVIKGLLDVCLEMRISWKIVPDLYAILVDWLKLDSLGGVPLLGMRRSNITGVNVLLKRLMDLALASVLLVLFGPLMLVVALLIKLTSPGPVLFKQKRVGQDGRRFVFLKFRSMYPRTRQAKHRDFATAWVHGSGRAVEEERGRQVYKMTRDPRVTPIGRLLRKFSLDELPQLFNVLKGDMSVIGPRPPIPYEVDVYKEWHRRRLEAKPGITGLWQVRGRNRLPFDEMVKLDIYYIENWSVVLDLQIMFKTVWVMLFGSAY
ncbi:MAG: sugar transferase [Planctomycetes bacterium]|nr:sugar transferase [Planctomycetota bacterium]